MPLWTTLRRAYEDSDRHAGLLVDSLCDWATRKTNTVGDSAVGALSHPQPLRRFSLRKFLRLAPRLKAPIGGAL